jgi:hypothetical protein
LPSVALLARLLAITNSSVRPDGVEGGWSREGGADNQPEHHLKTNQEPDNQHHAQADNCLHPQIKQQLRGTVKTHQQSDTCKERRIECWLKKKKNLVAVIDRCEEAAKPHKLEIKEH